jgi:hypothetical protein
METGALEAKLIVVLANIQQESGYSAAAITTATCPIDDLEGFDSKIWPVAIGVLAAELGVSIPNNQNIFISQDGQRRLTVAEAAARVGEIVRAEEVGAHG